MAEASVPANDVSDELTWLLGSISFSLACLSLLVSVPVVILFVKNKDMSKPLNLLNVAGLLAGDIMQEIGLIAAYSSRRWVFGTLDTTYIQCQVEGFFVSVGALVSLAAISSIAFERYNIIIRNVTYSLKFYRVLLVGAWVWALITVISLTVLGGMVRNPAGYNCIPKFGTRDPLQLTALLAGAFMIPCTIVCTAFCYFAIARRIMAVRGELRVVTHESNSMIKGNWLSDSKRQDIRLAFQSSVVAIIFLSLWGSLGIVYVYEMVSGQLPTPYIVEPAMNMLAFLHTLADGVLVVALDPTLRKAFLDLINPYRHGVDVVSSAAVASGSLVTDPGKRSRIGSAVGVPAPPRDVMKVKRSRALSMDPDQETGAEAKPTL